MSDRLATARRLAWASGLLSATLVGAVLAWATVSGQATDPRPAALAALRSTRPALVPGGLPARHPESMHPAIDLRHAPQVGRVPGDDAPLVLPAP